MSEQEPKVLVLGTGPVGTGLARSLRIANVSVLGIWGRNPVALADAAEKAKVFAAAGTKPPLALAAEADVLVLAVRDAAIAEVASMLAEGGCLAHAPILLHCSGSISSGQAFASVLSELGGHGLLHPLRALARGDLAENFHGTTFGVQGDEAGLAAATNLCTALGGRPLPLEAAQMPGYHTAAVFASNYLVALMDVALAMAEASGLDREASREGLLALAEGALAGARKQGTLAALTGPIRRGDAAPIAGHLQFLQANLPTATDLYAEIGRWTLGMSRRCGNASEAELSAIERLLGQSE